MIRIIKGDITIEIDTLPEIARLYDNQEVADLLGKSIRPIGQLKQRGKLPHGKVSGLDILMFLLGG